MKKRFLGLILTLSMLLALSAPITGVQAALGIRHETEVSLMAALGIVPGYPDNYNPDSTVTQADFVKYAYAAVDTEISNPEEYAKSIGLDGGSPITYAQAERIVIQATGYSNIMNGEDPHSYAMSLGLLSGCSSSSESAQVTLESAAMMLYNAINLKSIELDNRTYKRTNKIIMEDLLDVYKEYGIITANNVTALSGNGTTSKSDVRIGNILYNVGTTTASSMIGKAVKFYYKDDEDSGELVIKWIEEDKSRNNTAVIYGCDITDITSAGIVYDSDKGSNKTARIDRDAEIIYNDKASSGVTLDAARSLNCEVTLIANNGTTTYNVVIIRDYTYYLVEAVTASSMTVNDYQSKETLDIDEQNYSTFSIYKNGMPVSASDIKTGQVLAVVRSEDGKDISIEILEGSVSGEITSYSTDFVTIGGTRYDISAAYAGDQLKLGRSGTFYFDKLGKIVRCVSDKGQNSKYGYLMKYYPKDDGGEDYMARLLTAEGTVTDLAVKNSVTFNGSKKSAHDVYNLLDARNNCEQLINYKLNSDNSIGSIDTADERYLGVDEQNIDDFTIHFKGAGKYRKANMCFNTKYLIDSTTPIFFIPYDGDKDDYTIKDASYLTNNWTYDISVYDIDDYMYSSAIVLKENVIEPENLRTKRPLLITKVVEAIDDEGEERIQLQGYFQGSKTSYMIYNNDMYDNRNVTQVRDLKAGDVIQFGLDSEDRINAVQILYRASIDKLSIANGTTTPNRYWEGGSAIFPDLWATCGKVVDRNSDVILVDDDGDDTVVSKNPHKLGTASVYIYEHEKITVSNKNEISVGDTVYVHEYQGNVRDVLIVR